VISRWLTVPYKRYRPVKKTDPQRHKLYSMERELIGQSIHTRSSRKHLRDVIAHACRKYKVKPIALRFINKPEEKLFGYHEAPPPAIVLNQGFHGANLFTLLHELAHYITDCKYTDVPDHGPEFVKVYMDLLHRYRIIPDYVFKVMAQRHGVTWGQN